MVKHTQIRTAEQTRAAEAAPRSADRADEPPRGHGRAAQAPGGGLRGRLHHGCLLLDIVRLGRINHALGRAAGDIVDEINRLHAHGIREAVLTGVHIGGYGSDTGSSLYDLLARILAETDIPRLRLGSVEPWDLGDRFFSLFENPRMMPHLHLPLQSGSDTVLKRMARRCRTADFRNLIAAARDAVPDFNPTTDIIVGFPGETNAEWRESLAFIEEIGFPHVHIFSYSQRAGTRAAELPDQVDAATRRRRSQTLHALARRMKQDFATRWRGRGTEILIETVSQDAKTGVFHGYGYTPNYQRVRVTGTGPGPAVSDLCPVTIGGYDEAEEILVGDLRSQD